MTSPYVAPSGVPPPPGSYMPPGGYAPQPQPTPPPRQRGLLLTIGLATAILLATAALVVGIIAISRPTASTPANRTPPSGSPTATATDTSAADRKLCKDVGPLLRESDETGKNFVNLGQPEPPPAMRASLTIRPRYLDWVKRIQPIVDSHAEADPFLKRTLQRMVDDIRI